MQKRARECQTATHALRELRDQLIGLLRQTDALEENLRSLCLAAVQPREEPQVLPGGQPQIVVRRLERHANSTVVVPVPGAQIPAQDIHAAFILVQQTNQNVVGGALPGSARPKKAKNFVSLNGEREVTHRRSLGTRVREAKGFCLDDWIGRDGELGHVHGAVVSGHSGRLFGQP